MRHIIGILLQNESGALARVAGLFSSRGYNIESLAVSTTQDEALSRITLVTTGSEAVLQQIVAQLNKLVDIVTVRLMTPGDHLERELVLLRLRVARGRKEEVLAKVKAAGGRVLEDGPEDTIIELVASEAGITRFVQEAAGLGELVKVVRSGTIAVSRGALDPHTAAIV